MLPVHLTKNQYYQYVNTTGYMILSAFQMVKLLQTIKHQSNR